jgi:hypothetical protein
MSAFDVEAARAAFRAGRRREALFLMTVAALIAAVGMVISVYLGSDLARSLPYAAGLLALSFGVGYRGLGRPGFALGALLLGLMPLGCASLAQTVGHVCTPGGCVSLCVPLCTSGGGLAGFLLSRMSAAQAPRARFFAAKAWWGGAGLVVLTGAMGCSCVGWGGIVGMILGVVGTELSWSVFSALRRT